VVGGGVGVARLGEGRGGTLRPILPSDADSLDPQVTVTGYDVFSRIMEPLAQPNLNWEIEGILAESWEISEDLLEYTFHLRQGITYHDGTPFNAEAVKFVFDRVIDPKLVVPFRSWVGPLKETVVVDEDTANLVRSETFSPLLGNIAIGWYALPSPTAVQQMGTDFGRHPVGTGPFMFKEWVPAQSFTIVPNPNYKNNPRSWAQNKGAPLLDAVEYH